MSVHIWAEKYINKGWQVTPLIPKTKKAPDNWKILRFKVEDFRMDDNIGIKSVDGLVVVDLDAPESVKCADAFLPPTGTIWGRPSKRRSKWLYICPDVTRIHTFQDQKHKNTDKAMLVELRANHQDMAPPSIHPNGEKLSWDGEIREPATIEAAELFRSIQLIATCSLLIRYYNAPGSRHAWMLAVVGTLQRFDLKEEEVQKVILTAAKIVGDVKTSDRMLEIQTTYQRDKDQATASFAALKESSQEESLVKSLKKIWKFGTGDFARSEKGIIFKDNQENIRMALERLNIELSYDRFSRHMYMTTDGKKDLLKDEPIIRMWLEIDEQFHFRPGKQFFFDVVQDLARQQAYHPVIDYLKSLKWDGVERCNQWLSHAVGAENNDYIRAISRIVLVAAVKRVLKPGCLFQEMVVLESNEQGLEKSSTIKALCPNEEWFSDNLPLNVESKELIEMTAGKWIIEASDLAGMRRSQIEHLKSMMARQVDGPVRMAYAHVAHEQPRQFIIIGTTNSYSYLLDPTGNRRFWPVRCDEKGCNVRWVLDNRDQLWAEAFAREQRGESIRLDKSLWAFAKMQQERRTIGDPWETTLQEAFPGDHYRLTNDEVYKKLGLQIDRRDTTSAHRISSIMQKLGFVRKTVRPTNGVPQRGWAKGDRLTAATNQQTESRNEPF